ncbi:MAG: HAMP domain-containing histidine kinase [Acidimicrobiia bacterium]|nr:HAMP domain-containing histidine kinase [Acidimicrobiia bacterium]
MVRPRGHLLTAAVILTTCVLIVFTVLQYRWSREINEATGVRLADTLQMSMVNWHLDLQRNFDEAARTLFVEPASDAEYALRYREWTALARYPAFIGGVYLLEPGPSGTGRARRLDSGTGRLEPAPWPTSAPAFADLSRVTNTAWSFDPGHLALVRRTGSPAPEWALVSFDAGVLTDVILPTLAHRYFEGTDGLDYEVAVTAGASPPLYTSDEGFGAGPVPDADGTLNIFARDLTGRGPSPIEIFHAIPEHRSAVVDTIVWYPLPAGAAPADDWTLVVRHRRGGALGAFLEDTYHRDLTMSLGALALLVTSIAMLVMASHRAQRLAALQMDFVTTVSHELRTPLAVICSAADNISQGVVRGRDQLVEYGSVIAGQARQLSTLVEEVLLFARQARGANRVALRPVSVGDAIEATLASTEGLVRAEQFELSCHVERDLPAVMGDVVSLSQCLQNLVTNALKYGRQRRWIGIDARLNTDEAGRREVRVTVADRGMGISPAEIPRIFEPFYRSPSATAAQTRGTGLGLSLAKGLAEMMGGRITVSSEPGRGSAFTVHLPCIEGPAGSGTPASSRSAA